jgi:hypothetical protein
VFIALHQEHSGWSDAMARSHRTYWVIRQRYRRAGYLGSVLATVICAVLIIPYVHGAQSAIPADQSTELLTDIGALVAAVLVPPLLARLCWRLHRRRYFADMYLITPH